MCSFLPIYVDNSDIGILFWSNHSATPLIRKKSTPGRYRLRTISKLCPSFHGKPDPTSPLAFLWNILTHQEQTCLQLPVQTCPLPAQSSHSWLGRNTCQEMFGLTSLTVSIHPFILSFLHILQPSLMNHLLRMHLNPYPSKVCFSPPFL